jgi:hypothetical protein
MRERRVWQHPLLWMLCLSVALSVANGLILPAFEAMDEPEHFHFARYLAEGHGLPDQRDITSAVAYGYRQEGGQAPLYYLLSALVLRALGEDVGDVEALTVPNPLSTCGITSETHDKGMWLRNPAREQWPYRGAALGNHVLRLLGAVLAAVTVGGVYRTARVAFPQMRSAGLLAAALVGLNPRFLTHSGTMTNDVMAAALAAWVIYLAVATLRWGPALNRSVALGLTLGLAALTKASGVVLLSPVGLALADWSWRERQGLRALRHALLIGGLCLATAGWWYLGNLLRYGNPGLVPLFTRETGLRNGWPPHLVIPEIGNYFRTYWAASAYCELQLGVYPVYGAISLVGLGGVVLAMRRVKVDVRRHAMFLAVWMGTTFAAWLRFNTLVWAPEGRYWFQAHAAIAPLLAAGLLYLFGQWSWSWRALIIVLGVLALGTPVGILAPLFVPPVRRPVGEVSVPHPLEATFGDGVALVGFEVGGDTYRAGEAVDLTLYLTAQHPLTESLMLSLQVESAGPSDDALLANFRSWPGGGNYPTTAWQPGELLVDQYRVPLPADVQELQLWDLNLIFLYPDPAPGQAERLPVRIGGVAGGPYVTLARLRVEPRQNPVVPTAAALHPPPAFGHGREVVLEARRIERGEGGLDIDLWWRVAKPLSGAYAVFVHLLDQDGHLVATGDDLPRGGAMPTEYWQAGDVIVDGYWVPLPDDLAEGVYRVGVGFYDAVQRLPAWHGTGRALPDGTAIIGEWR